MQEHPWKNLTDKNRSLYTQHDVLSTWSECFEKRIQLIVPPLQSKEKPASVESYLETFKCLCPPIGITLVFIFIFHSCNIVIGNLYGVNINDYSFCSWKQITIKSLNRKSKTTNTQKMSTKLFYHQLGLRMLQK